MSDKLSKFLNIFLGVIIAISVVIVFLFYKNVTPLDEVDQLQSGLVDTFLLWAGILLAITAAVAFLVPVVNLVLNPKAAIKSLISIAVIAAIVGISYSMSSGELLDLAKNPDNNPTTLKLTDTGLYTMYILSILTVLAVIYSEVSKIFK